MRVNKVYAVNLRQIREDRGISQTALATATGYSESVIRNYEDGCTCPSVKTLCQIADVLGVSLDYLVGRNGQDANDCTLEAYCRYGGKSPEAARAEHKSRHLKPIEWR